MGKITKKLVVGYGGEPSEYYISINRKDMPLLITKKGKARIEVKEAHCIDYPKYGMKSKITKFNMIQDDGHISKFSNRTNEFSVQDDIVNKYGFELAKKDLPQADEKFLEYNKGHILNQKLVNACENIIHHKK